jgi:hypothetical protein
MPRRRRGFLQIVTEFVIAALSRQNSVKIISTLLPRIELPQNDAAQFLTLLAASGVQALSCNLVVD